MSSRTLASHPAPSQPLSPPDSAGTAAGGPPALPAGATARGRGRPRKTTEGSARRTEIIQVAARCFRLKGFDATTTRDIANESGMQSGSPFYHFKTKNDLLFAVMQEGMTNALCGQERALAKLPANASLEHQLYTLVLHHLHVLLGPGNDFIAVMVTEQRALLPEHREAIRDIRDRYEQIWRDLLSQLEQQGALRAPASLTRLALFGALHGSLNWYDTQQRLSLSDLAAHYLAIFVPGGNPLPGALPQPTPTATPVAPSPAKGGRSSHLHQL